LTRPLARKAGHLATHLSHGEKRHLEIGIALASDPALLLLGEPTAGMSPEETDETMLLIRELAERSHRRARRAQDEARDAHLRPDHGAPSRTGAGGGCPGGRNSEVVQRTYLGAAR
jgi:branched-chain amino acid transport system ATP-binding protein